MKLAYSDRHDSVVWSDLTTDELARVTQVPHCVRTAWSDFVAAPCTIESQAAAASMKLPAYSPILVKEKYDWPRAPHIKAPFAHQREMAAMLTLHPRMHNLAEIGTGKTLGCLWAADFLMRAKSLRRVVVACPLSTVNSVWRNHIGEHFGGLRRSAVCAGDKRKRLAALGSDADFIILNNEAFTLDYVQQALAERDDIDLVIIDESDRYRNRTTDRYKAMHAYVNGAVPKAVWMNTGTPTPRLPTDAWAQQNLLKKPHQSYRQFEDRTTFKITPFKRVPTSNAKDDVVALLQPAIRFLRDDCIDLPETQVISQQVDITTAQVHALRQLKQQLRLEIGGKSITALNEGVLRGKILQVMAGAVYDAQHGIHIVDSKPRIAMVQDLCDSSEGKTLVFTHLTSIAQMLHRELGGQLVIGATTLAQRTAIFEGFQKAPKGGDFDVITADARCMSHGLTLTAADKVIWYTPADSSGTYVQANGRITRPGQQRKTLIYQLWVAMLEKQVYLRHMGAEALQGLVMSWMDEDF
jgi:SNF2-related domain/Helicase conserved C-terminal domain